MSRGEIEFKWIFYAAVDEGYEPPNTGLLGVNSTFWVLAIIVLAVLTGRLMLLVLLKKKQQEKGKQP